MKEQITTILDCGCVFYQTYYDPCDYHLEHSLPQEVLNDIVLNKAINILDDII